MPVRRVKPLLLAVALLLPSSVARAGQAAEPAPGSVARFQATEQALMGSLASGDKAPWERVLDASCVITTEEGEVLSRDAKFAPLVWTRVD
jgi:hypothetical protein